MLDRRFVLENLDLIRTNCANRGVSLDLDSLASIEAERKAADQELQELNRKSNEVAGQIKKAKSQEERQPLIDEGRAIREAKDAAQARLDEQTAKANAVLVQIPNLSHADAPIGKDDKANLEIRKGKHEPKKFDFQPLDHVVLGEKLDMIDFEGGARTTGAGFYFLKNDAVLLDLALQQFAVQKLIRHGFTPTITPDLAQNKILEGIGFNPRGEETQVYSIENTELSLVGTAEITLGGLYADQVLEEEILPLKICGVSHCYRTEAGAAGRASRGLYRVHQFTKVEMFAFSTPEQSDAVLEQFCELEGEIFDDLGIAYRVVDTATGDLGGPAYRKYDLEAWMPGRGDGGEYGEVTSTSNCTDYQARRLNIRYKKKGEKGTQLVHTLNGTAVALSRAMLAVMENYQQADGTILVPEVLQAIMGKKVMGGSE